MVTNGKNFPTRTIECPHYIVTSCGAVDTCAMCGASRKAITECDHGVSLSDPCEKCGNTMPAKKLTERFKKWLGI